LKIFLNSSSLTNFTFHSFSSERPVFLHGLLYFNNRTSKELAVNSHQHLPFKIKKTIPFDGNSLRPSPCEATPVFAGPVVQWASQKFKPGGLGFSVLLLVLNWIG